MKKQETKKPEKKNTLAKAKTAEMPALPERLAVAARDFAGTLSMYAEIGLVQPENLPVLMTQLKFIGDHVGKLQKLANDRLKKLVIEKGIPIEDTCSLGMELGGYELRVQKRNEGKLDDSKVEALLRGLNLDPAKHMATTISYAIDPDKLAVLKAQKKLSEEDLKTCQKDVVYALEQPRKKEEPS